MSTPTIHCICGPIAAGKSTLARELAARVGGLRLAIDEWMHGLYGPDRPEPLDPGWIAPRVLRCRETMWSVVREALARGVDVVIEFGLTTLQERNALRARAAASGHVLRFHHVDAPRGVRLDRALRRNVERGPTYAFDITPAMFDFMDARYEHPTAQERLASASAARQEHP